MWKKTGQNPHIKGHSSARFIINLEKQNRMLSSSLKTSIAAGLALASLSAAIELEAKATPDSVWPDDNCCRLYTEPGFTGFS